MAIDTKKEQERDELHRAIQQVLRDEIDKFIAKIEVNA